MLAKRSARDPLPNACGAAAAPVEEPEPAPPGPEEGVRTTFAMGLVLLGLALTAAWLVAVLWLPLSVFSW